MTGRFRAIPRDPHARARCRRTPGADCWCCGLPTSRCQLKPAIYQGFSDVDSALAAAERFLLKFVAESDTLYGSEGMNAGFRRATEAMSKCFDWGRLVSEVPREEDFTEFSVLNRMLSPYLLNTDWPTWPEVMHAWPSDTLMKAQYKMLLQRIRHCSYRRTWWKPTGFEVEPVLAPASRVKQVADCFRQYGAGAGASPAEIHAVAARVASVIVSFEGRYRNFAAGARSDAFRVSAGAVLRCGFRSPALIHYTGFRTILSLKEKIYVYPRNAFSSPRQCAYAN